MVTGGGRMIYAGKGKDDVLAWVKRKRLKQVLRNQRKHREEIQQEKQLDAQQRVIAAIVMSTALQDSDMQADDERIVAALKQYDTDARTNKSAAWAELERKLWIPPRIRDSDGLSHTALPLPLDFIDTPEVRAERRRQRLWAGAVPGRGVLHDQVYPPGTCVDSPQTLHSRVKGAWDEEESSDENSAPDYDAATYIDPSVYALPQGDVASPHREGAEWVKEVVEVQWLI